MRAQAEKTKQALLYHAACLFLERGFHGTSIDSITKAAKVSKGAFYWHFTSKIELLQAFIKKFEEDFLDRLIAKVKRTEGNALQKLRKVMRYNAAFAYYNPELCISFTTLSAEFSGTNAPAEEKIKKIYAKYRSFLSNLIKIGQREGIFRVQIDSDLVARIIIAFHDGILIEWWRNKKEIDGEAYVKLYEDVLLKGILASTEGKRDEF